ncbi:MAG: DMT family transporter [Burkholderiales bacterium]|nr:DMT family transporter [Burkholderiales bacterium]
MAGFALSDAMAKRLTGAFSPFAIAWFRYLFLLATVLPLALARPARWRSARPVLQAGRAAALVGSALLFLFGLRALPVAEATAMVFASPLFVTLLAMLVLREHVAPWRWLPVAVGFAGVLIVVRPGSLGFGGAELFPIASSMAWACAVIFTRKLGSHDSAATTMLYSGVLGAACLTLLLPPLDTAALRAHAPLLLAMAGAWCCAQWLTIAAYRSAAPSAIAPYAYSQLIWAGLLGWLLLRHVPDAVSLAGMGVILASGLGAAWQERRSFGR